jgi:hypothetical protein
MAKSPGKVIRHYLGGKRRSYLNPFSHLLFCSALYVLGQSALALVQSGASPQELQDVREWGAALNAVEDQFTLVAYGTVPVVASLGVAMRAVFTSRFLNVAEAVASTVYTSGNVFLQTLVVSAAYFGFTGNQPAFWETALTFAALFPPNLIHVGLGLFKRRSMAVYTALASVLAVIIGTSASFLVSVLGTPLRLLSSRAGASPIRCILSPQW